MGLGAQLFQTASASFEYFKMTSGTQKRLGNKHPRVGTAKKRDTSSNNTIGSALGGGNVLVKIVVVVILHKLALAKKNYNIYKQKYYNYMVNLVRCNNLK